MNMISVQSSNPHHLQSHGKHH